MHNFECLSTGLDVRPLKEAISRKEELWDQITGRQDYPGSTHKDTESIFLRWCKGLDIQSAFTEIPAFNFPAIGMLPEAHELINYTLHRVGATELGRILVVRLHQGGKILPHADEGAYADHYERFHIAVAADPGCQFICGDETVEMKTGELWSFNHKAQHSVDNQSGKERIHMIIDCVAPQFHRERLEIAV